VGSAHQLKRINTGNTVGKAHPTKLAAPEHHVVTECERPRTFELEDYRIKNILVY
jgi:hypothetical protein